MRAGRPGGGRRMVSQRTRPSPDQPGRTVMTCSCGFHTRALTDRELGLASRVHQHRHFVGRIHEWSPTE